MTASGGGPILSAMEWRALRLLLVLLTLFGLVGQTAVYAMAPLAAPAVRTLEVAAPSDDCAGMAVGDSDEMPCNGMTLDCIAKMGCLTPPVVAPTAGLATHPVIYERVAYSALRETMAGVTVQPEIFPPIA